MTTSHSPAPGPTNRATNQAANRPANRAATREVFVAFLRLGLTSFGGPVAHLGYFREAFAVRRRWLGDVAAGPRGWAVL